MQSGRSVACLSVAAPALLVSMIVGGPIAECLFVLLVPVLPLGLIALATRDTRRRRSRIVFLSGAALLYESGSVAVLWLSRHPGALGPVLGLPASTALMLGLLGVAPLLWFAVGHALLFEERP